MRNAHRCREPSRAVRHDGEDGQCRMTFEVSKTSKVWLTVSRKPRAVSIEMTP